MVAAITSCNLLTVTASNACGHLSKTGKTFYMSKRYNMELKKTKLGTGIGLVKSFEVEEVH